jgi:hypothetical protein
MTATTASDPSGVEYYFDEISGNPGGTDSGWQDDPTYEDTGLQPNTGYAYQVSARDKSANQNVTVPSSEGSATTDPHIGPPLEATNPSPSDGQGNVNRNTVILSWTAGVGATSHDVYLGINPTPGAGDFKGNQTGTTYDPQALDRRTTYYWRIDEVNSDGTTPGPVWNFTTK